MGAILRLLILALAGLGAAACDDGPTLPAAPAGTLSFQFTGGLPDLFENGSFSVEGAPRLDALGRPERTEWALAGPHPTSGLILPAGSKLAVVGFHPTLPEEPGLGALAVITIPRTASPGTVPIDADCLAVDCARVMILMVESPAAPHREVEGACEVTEGSVRIESATASRVRGSFSGRGYCAFDVRFDPLHEFEITTGEFDVEIDERYRTGLEIWS